MDNEERVLALASVFLAGSDDLNGHQAIVLAAFVVDWIEAGERFEKDLEPKRWNA